jgi:hypothetical protein
MTPSTNELGLKGSAHHPGHLKRLTWSPITAPPGRLQTAGAAVPRGPGSKESRGHQAPPSCDESRDTSLAFTLTGQRVRALSGLAGSSCPPPRRGPRQPVLGSSSRAFELPGVASASERRAPPRRRRRPREVLAAERARGGGLYPSATCRAPCRHRPRGNRPLRTRDRVRWTLPHRGLAGSLPPRHLTGRLSSLCCHHGCYAPCHC